MKFLVLLISMSFALTGCVNNITPPVDTEEEPVQYKPLRPVSQRPAPVNPGQNYETGGGGFSEEEKKVFFEEGSILVEQFGYNLTIRGLFGSIAYNVDTGYAQIYKTGQSEAALKDVHAEVRINNPAGGNEPTVRTPYLTRDHLSVYVNPLDDGFGKGVKVTVENLGGMLIIFQNFYVYQSRRYLIVDTVAELATTDARTNYIAALRVGKAGETETVVNLGSYQPDRSLFVPYDNDDFVRFNARSLTANPQTGNLDSCEVSAIYHNTSRNGFILGSISHDTWKTAVRLIKTQNRISGISVFAGYTSYQTRDAPDSNTSSRSHGIVTGETVRSPGIFLGFYNDWRDGMEEYGRANGITAPPLHWPHGVPFGFNSWGAYADEISYETYVDVSDFIKQFLPDFTNGTDGVYVNFDSFWTNLSEQQRRDAANHVRNNGHIAGIYHSPFTSWHGLDVEWLKTAQVEGVPEWTWYDIILKDHAGNLIRYINNMGWALDPTHPGTIALNRLRMIQFINWGFRFVKLDFLSHGAMEGDFYNKSITTGKQAYSYGMQELLNAIGPRMLNNGEFFVSLSIAPIFPSQFAHARRISCDVFGGINDTEYMLNSLTYGWWIHNAVYPFNDPDYVVLYSPYNRNRVSTHNEALSAYIAAAITGGQMMFSDDITVQEAGERVKQILNNESINKLVSDGKTFRPVEGNTGSDSADLFVRDDRDINGNFYFAAFNFGGRLIGYPVGTKTMTVNFERMGLDPEASYTVYDMINQQSLNTVITGPQWTMPQMSAGEPRLYALMLYTDG